MGALLCYPTLAQIRLLEITAIAVENASNRPGRSGAREGKLAGAFIGRVRGGLHPLERRDRGREVVQNERLPLFRILESTLRQECRNYGEQGVDGLRDESSRQGHSPNRTHGNLVHRILPRRSRRPAWEAMRIRALQHRGGSS